MPAAPITAAISPPPDSDLQADVQAAYAELAALAGLLVETESSAAPSPTAGGLPAQKIANSQLTVGSLSPESLTAPGFEPCAVSAAPSLGETPSLGDVQTNNLTPTKRRKSKSTNQPGKTRSLARRASELTSLAEKARVSHFATIIVPDEIVDKATDRQSDPCKAVQAWIDDKVLWYPRKHKLDLAYISVIEVDPAASGQNSRSPNRDHGLHVHIALTGLKPEHEDGFTAFLARLSNRIEVAAASYAGYAPRATWYPKHVTSDNCGCPINLGPADYLPGLINYMLKHYDLTEERIRKMMSNYTGRKRSPRPVHVTKPMYRVAAENVLQNVFRAVMGAI